MTHIIQGAASTLWACLSPSVMSVDRGAYVIDCAPALPTENGQDRDKTMRKALWETVEKEIAALDL